MTVPSGNQSVRVSYLFDDGYRNGQIIPGPYAILRVNVLHGSDEHALAASGLPLPWQAAVFLPDFLLGMVLGYLLFYYAWLLSSAWRGILLFSVLGGVAWWGLPELTFMLIMPLAMVWLLLWQGNHRLLLAFVTLSILLWFRVWAYLPDPSYSLLRWETSDMLAFESFARDILATGTLRAGESVYDFSPLIRYIVFVYHIVFGESDFLRSQAILLLLNMGIFINAEWMYKNRIRQQQNLWRNGLVWVGYIAIVALSASSIIYLIQQGIAEMVSWIFILYAFYFLLLGGDGFFLTAAVLIGLAINNRYNHLPALGFLLLIFALPILRTKKRLILLSVSLIALILALIPLHNWVYGHQLIFIPLSGYNTRTVILPPSTLMMFFTNPGVQLEVFNQTLITFGIVNWRTIDLSIPIFILMMCWLLLGVDLVKRWKIIPLRTRWMWVIPGIFLGTQFFWYKLMNYPRQLYAGYLAIALVGMYSLWYSKNKIKEPPKID
jgi:hypothetical protein